MNGAPELKYEVPFEIGTYDHCCESGSESAWVHIDLVLLDPDPGARKLTKINK
jgi:hypothetical protein